MIAAMKALLLMRCPCCKQGPMFRGPFRMNKHCSSCHLDFEPEPGYYIGALYANYFLGLGVLSPLVAWMIWKDYGAYAIFGASVLGLAICSPLVFSYARAIWIYLDMLLFDTKRCRPARIKEG